MANMATTVGAVSADLFPILPSERSESVDPGNPATHGTALDTHGALTGIARLASKSCHAAVGHLVEFRSLEVRSILNRSYSNRTQTVWRTINPYRGCEFACRYCYARYTHEFMELRNPEDFERKIFIKQNAAWLLEQELRKLSSSGGPGEEIAIGTATDPYQPIERTARVTRSLLEVFAGHSGLRIGIVTKSTLIERDIAVLQRIAERNRLVLHLTITTPKAALARILEPLAPRPDLRFRTVQRLRQAGLHAGILCSPLLPGITDTAAALEAMVRRAKAADASFFAAEPVFLKGGSRETYFAFIREHFPELETMYRQRFDGAGFVSAAYRERIRALVGAVVKKHGLNLRSTDAMLTRDIGRDFACAPCEAQPAQASLFPAQAANQAIQQAIQPKRTKPSRIAGFEINGLGIAKAAG